MARRQRDMSQILPLCAGKKQKVANYSTGGTESCLCCPQKTYYKIPTHRPDIIIVLSIHCQKNVCKIVLIFKYFWWGGHMMKVLLDLT